MDLYTNRKSQYAIAAILGVSQPTVQRDVQHGLAEWAAKRAARLDIHRDRELAELDKMEEAAVDGFFSCAEGSDQARKFLEVRLKIKQRRARLLGLDAEIHKTVKVEGGDNPIQAQVLHAHIDMRHIDDDTLYKLANYGDRKRIIDSK